ncbi:uncharacterized protein LOC114368026 [Glycine soja]|uniref:uncharacterized protein LOC114368026 n=1 Tax=Glycine soja TaxID=3848 RepID=UPI00103A96BE|nr:uncharacterized protein LOC114368026 [Glycine soja]
MPPSRGTSLWYLERRWCLRVFGGCGTWNWPVVRVFCGEGGIWLMFHGDKSITGAHLLCYPGAFNMTTGSLHWELLQRARATDNLQFLMDEPNKRLETVALN